MVKSNVGNMVKDFTVCTCSSDTLNFFGEYERRTCAITQSDIGVGVFNASPSTLLVGTFTSIKAGSNIGVHYQLLAYGMLGWQSYNEVFPPAESFTQIDTGSYFTCGIKTDATLECWGKDEKGQSSPPAGTFAQLSTGGEHACGITTNGALECWGDNTFGQTSIPSGSYLQVSAGTSHTCAVTTNGAVECWGENEDNRATPPDDWSIFHTP